MAKSIVGFEFGNSRMKIAEVNGTSIKKFTCVELPENMVMGDQIVTWDPLVEVIRTTLKDNGISSKNAAVVIPDINSYLRKITMPMMNEQQLMVNLPYEFRDVINDEINKYTFDYAMLNVINDEEGNPKEMELLAAAVSKNLMARYIDLFKRAGLKLVKAAPRELAVAAVLREYDEGAANEDRAILDLGASRTLLDFFHEGVYEITRNIDLGVDEVAKVAGDVLNCDFHIAKMYLRDNKDDVLHSEPVQNVFDLTATDIMRALNYYSFENPNNTLNKLYYTGGGAWMTDYLQAIANSIGLQLVPLSDLNNENTEAMIDGPAAVGICLD